MTSSCMNGYFAAGANTMGGGRELKDVALLELPLTVDESGAARANAFQMFGGQFISASGRQSGCMIDQVRGVMGLKLAGEAALRMDLVADRASSHPILGEAALMSRPRLIVSLPVRKDSKCIVDGAVIGQVRQRGHFWKAIADYHTSELAEWESVPLRYARITQGDELRGPNASYKCHAWTEPRSAKRTGGECHT